MIRENRHVEHIDDRGEGIRVLPADVPLANVGFAVGRTEGLVDGAPLGFGVGADIIYVGPTVGACDGRVDGDTEGLGVGEPGNR